MPAVIVNRLADRLALEERNRVLGAQLNGRAASPRDLLAPMVAIAALVRGLAHGDPGC